MFAAAAAEVARRSPGIGPEGMGCPSVSRRIVADYRPIILPAHRLQMNDAAVRAVGLKVNEPSLAVRRFDVAALMRTVDPGRTLRQHNAMLVRPIDLPRTQHRLRASRRRRRKGQRCSSIRRACRAWDLPGRANAPRSCTMILPSSSTCLPSGDMRCRISGPAPVFEWIRYALPSSSQKGHGSSSPGLRHYYGRLAPRTGNLRRGAHENAFARSRKVDIVKAVVLADRRRPHSFP